MRRPLRRRSRGERAKTPCADAVAPERGLVFSGTYTLPGAPFSFGAHAVVVEVSRETGQVTILRYVGIHDCGRIVNPRLVEGQIIGGIAQGLGQALSEDVVYSPEGQPLTGSLLDYALPKAHEVPPFILETLEVPSPTNPLGAKGIGSVSTVPAPAAVANAVLDALAGAFGVRHLDTPLTAEGMACDAGRRYQRKTEFESLERILYHVTTQSDVITAETAYVGHKGLTPPRYITQAFENTCLTKNAADVSR